MSVSKRPAQKEVSRRTFLAHSGTLAAAGAAVVQFSPLRSAHAASSDELKVALIGCGGRGTGAAVQALSTAGPVKLWAMADAFADRLQISLNAIQKGQAQRNDKEEHSGFKAKVDVPPERQFIGLDAYRHAIDSGVDVVVFAEPPGFRPEHFEYAVRAGKHMFIEKPLASDAPGVRRLLAANEEAKRKGLKIGVGLQRHHDPAYQEIVQQLQDGAIGDILYFRCYWNTANPAKTPPAREGLTEMQYQVRNWYFFAWLSGDHICEQHIHNLDVCNWVKNAHPVEAQGQGGRQVRTSKDYGHIFDHHSVEFTYADGTQMFSNCRQIPGCWNSVSEHAHGTKGYADIGTGAIEPAGYKPQPAGEGKSRRRRKTQGPNPYQIEHDVLFDAIRNDKPHNEVEHAAHSTMTAILGRMATYSGKVVTWDEAMESGLALVPQVADWDSVPPVLPDEQGFYPVAMPGTTEVLEG
ncbi:MAG: Gfo/Idh/MocA family protein [Planctomycetota bacterium]